MYLNAQGTTVQTKKQLKKIVMKIQTFLFDMYRISNNKTHTIVESTGVVYTLTQQIDQGVPVLDNIIFTR